MPHLPLIYVAILAIARVCWKVPDWGLKVVSLLDAIRRFRR
jgi:hypothetical protein